MDQKLTDLMVDWTRKIERTDTPILNYAQRFGWSMPCAPIIGHTPEGRGHGTWVKLNRWGYRLQQRMARLRPVTVTDDEGDEEQYWDRGQWDWVTALKRKAKATEAKPIYDPDWVPPAPKTKVEWGFHQPAFSRELEDELLTGRPVSE